MLPSTFTLDHMSHAEQEYTMLLMIRTNTVCLALTYSVCLCTTPIDLQMLLHAPMREEQANVLINVPEADMMQAT